MIILPLLLTALTLSPTASPSSIPTVTRDNGSEIQKFREVIQEKVKAKLQEIGQTKIVDQKRGYIGTVTKIESDKINLDTKEKNHTISLDVGTTFLNPKSIKIKSTDLKVGQEILAIGLLDDQNNFSAKRIIITVPKSSQNLKTVIHGQVVDISTTTPIMALIPSINKNIQYQIKTNTKNLQIISKTGDKLTIKDITKGKKIIVIFPANPSPSTPQAAEKIIVL